MLGFVFGAGKRDGSVIRAISGVGGSRFTTPFGEIDGSLTPRLTRSPADLRPLVDAMRETLDVLRATGFKIIPSSTNMIKIIPRFIWVAVMRLVFSTKFGEVGAGWL